MSDFYNLVSVSDCRLRKWYKNIQCLLQRSFTAIQSIGTIHMKSLIEVLGMQKRDRVTDIGM